jgi:hypothetical protein
MVRIVNRMPGEPLGDDEARVALCPEGESPPRRLAVWRGSERVGWLLDWTVYPPLQVAAKDPALGYVMKVQPSGIEEVYGAEVRDGEGFRELEDAWPTRVQALAVILGEEVEG